MENVISEWTLSHRFASHAGPLDKEGWISICLRFRKPCRRLKGSYYLAYNHAEDRLAEGSDMSALRDRLANQPDTLEAIVSAIKAHSARIARPWKEGSF